MFTNPTPLVQNPCRKKHIDYNKSESYYDIEIAICLLEIMNHGTNIQISYNKCFKNNILY